MCSYPANSSSWVLLYLQKRVIMFWVDTSMYQLLRNRGSNATVQLSELGVKIYGVELPAKSPPRLCRGQDLGVSNDSAEQCKLGVSNAGAELRVQILKSYLQDIFVYFLKKRTKNKKIGSLAFFLSPLL